MMHSRLVIGIVASMPLAGCASTDWTREKLDLVEERVRAVTTEQLVGYDRKYQSALSQMDQHLIELNAKLESVQREMERTTRSVGEHERLIASLSAENQRRSEQLYPEVKSLVADLGLLRASAEETRSSLLSLEEETRGLKTRWDQEAETACKWHRRLVERLLDAVGRTAQEPMEEQKRSDPRTERLSFLLGQMARDMQTQLEASRSEWRSLASESGSSEGVRSAGDVP